MNRIFRLRFTAIRCLISLIIIVYAAGCSRETKTYDELVAEGRVESIARKQYSQFFKAVERLGEPEDSSTAESVLSERITQAASATDPVISDLRSFPSTFQSRISLDALSYAARDLAEPPGVSQTGVTDFWRNGLLDPIFTKGREYIKSEKTNDSTILQLVRALQRGMADRATDDMLLDIIPIVGPAPSEQVLEVCRNDSLVFKRVYDLIMYSRSLQEIGPPLWMMTGPWLIAVRIEGWPLAFYSLKPLIMGNSLFLTFRDYSLGEVYAAVFDDPIPDDLSRVDDWLSRAGAEMDSLTFDETFAEKARTSNLSVYDTHNFYNDYLLLANADSVKQEFRIIFKREKMQETPFQYAGVDSIEVLFSRTEIASRADLITPLAVMRYQGESMIDGRYIPASQDNGVALLMPMGFHDEEILRKLRESLLPEITVNAP